MILRVAPTASLLSVGATWVAVALLIPHAERWALMDHPGGRKTHRRSTPVVGGVAMAIGILCALLVLGAMKLVGLPLADAILQAPITAPVLAGAMLLLVVGVVDDRRGLSPAAKLMAQTIAAAPLVVLQDFALFQAWLPAWAASTAAIVWILAVVNAFNMLDGIDGLMGSVAVLCAAAIALLAWRWQVYDALFLLASLIGALLGFLRWNLPPARTFAGDGGALMTGYFIAAASLRISTEDPSRGATPHPYAILAIVLILAIPFYDLVSVVWVRLLERRGLFEGDTSHLAHRLVRRGLSPLRTLIFICGCTLLTALSGLLLASVGRAAAPAVLGQCLVVVGLLALMEAKTRPAPIP